MKVAVFIGGLSGGGAERVACNLAGHLAERNDVTILSMTDDEATYGLDNRVRRINLISGCERKNVIYDFLIRYWRLYKYLGSSKEDAYVVMLPITILMFFSLRWRTKAKVIASERNLPSTYPKWQQFLLRKLFRVANGWVFQTKEQKQWYGKDTKYSLQTIIPNAINKAFSLQKNIPCANRNYEIVNVGRLTSQKNQALLIKAYAALPENLAQFKLSFYGDGGLKQELKDLARQLKVGNRIEFKGFVKDIPSEIYNASLFVLSSDYEGMPNALMEAMALGLPCISTDCGGGGARALIKSEVNGLLVPCNDVAALKTAMIRVLSDSKFANELAKEAHNICEQLSPSKIYNDWEDFICKVIEKK